MANGLRLLWAVLADGSSASGAPAIPSTLNSPPLVAGVLWSTASDAMGIDKALGDNPGPDAVVLVASDARAALAALDATDAPLRRRAVLVLPLVDDPAADAELYARGVQDVLALSDLNDTLARRAAAALARKQLELLAHRAYATDPMTGLVNRQQRVEHLSHLLAVRAREPAPIGLVVLQVGTAQPLQGPLPHDEAVLVRRKIGVRLRAGVRASDVVASIGADSYAVMLSSIDSPTDTQTVATKLAVALRHPFTIGGQALSVAVEVGYAVSPEDGDEPEPLLRRAAMRITSTAFNPRHAANDP